MEIDGANKNNDDDDSDLVSRLRALPAAPPPPWALAENDDEDGGGLPRVVAAVDVAWGKDENTNEVAVACCVAFALPDLSKPLFVEFEPRQGLSRGPFAPYVPGKLFDREGPGLLVPLMRSVVERGKIAAAEASGSSFSSSSFPTTTATTTASSSLSPSLSQKAAPSPLLPTVDFFLVDGFGELHPRRFGSACALGVAAGGAPTAGVAKSMLLLSGGGKEQGAVTAPSDKEARRGRASWRDGEEIHPRPPPPSAPGMDTWYLGDDGSGKPIAVAMRPQGRGGRGGSGGGGGGGGASGDDVDVGGNDGDNGGGRCAFVSAGHRVPLDAAARAVLACYDEARRFRLPEPSRAADRLARERLRLELLEARKK